MGVREVTGPANLPKKKSGIGVIRPIKDHSIQDNNQINKKIKISFKNVGVYQINQKTGVGKQNPSYAKSMSKKLVGLFH